MSRRRARQLGVLRVFSQRRLAELNAIGRASHRRGADAADLRSRALATHRLGPPDATGVQHVAHAAKRPPSCWQSAEPPRSRPIGRGARRVGTSYEADFVHRANRSCAVPATASMPTPLLVPIVEVRVGCWRRRRTSRVRARIDAGGCPYREDRQERASRPTSPIVARSPSCSARDGSPAAKARLLNQLRRGWEGTPAMGKSNPRAPRAPAVAAARCARAAVPRTRSPDATGRRRPGGPVVLPAADRGDRDGCSPCGKRTVRLALRPIWQPDRVMATRTAREDHVSAPDWLAGAREVWR